MECPTLGPSTPEHGSINVTSTLQPPPMNREIPEDEMAREVKDQLSVKPDSVATSRNGAQMADTLTLPREILKQIIAHSLTSCNPLTMPCLTPIRPNFGLNTACLALDRDLYHTARHILYTHNTFKFSHFGTDITAISRCVGLYSCRQKECLQGGGPPVLGDAVFQLGCSLYPERSYMRIQAFSNVLQNLMAPLQVECLTLDIEAYAWRSNKQLKAFCEVLRNVEVRKSLIVKGWDVHLELDVRLLPVALGMDVQPVKSEARFRGADWRDLGHFISVYVPAGSVPVLADTKDPDEERAIVDPTSFYEDWLNTARQDCIVNGLDYVTDYGFEL